MERGASPLALPSGHLSSRTVILLGGLPACGKSTLARRLKEVFGDGAVHVEYDALEDSIVASEVQEERREAWNQARLLAVKQLEDSLRYNTEPMLILMDDNYHLRGMRKHIHRLLLNYKPINFGIIWVSTPLETCLERNHKRQRQRRVSEEVIRRMSQTLEPPRAAWESSWLDVSADTPFEKVLSYAMSCPEIVDLPDEIDQEQQKADRMATWQSQSHNHDKLLRGWVGTIANHDKTLARAANDARKEVLKMAKDQVGAPLTTDELASSFVDHILSAKSDKSRDELLPLLSNENKS